MEVRKKKSEDLKRFIEGFVYILFIIVTIIANTYGGIVFRLIPLLFLLGFIGKVFYSRPVITSLFGGVFSIITMYINGTYSTKEILLSSLTNLVLISLGEIFGICVMLTVVTISTKIKKKLSIKYVMISILFFALSVVITCYMNGNIFSYLGAENRLKEYLKTNYPSEAFEIEGYRYIPYVESGYSFKVKSNVSNGVYKFIIYDKNDAKIYDDYIKNLLISKNNNIKKYIVNNNINEDFNVIMSSEYVKENMARITVKYVTKDEKNYYDECSKLFDNVIKKMSIYDNFSDIYEIECIVMNHDNKNINTIFVDIKEYLKYSADGNEQNYILDLLNVEFFDF